MKKVLVLAAAAMLLAAPAMAGIALTKHDLSSGTTAGQATSNTDEICVFCHTPHGAQTIGPLWNKVGAGTAITNVYGDPSGTIDATLNLSMLQNSDAPLCLTCHDGATIVGDLTNPPNALNNVDPTITDGGNISAGLMTGQPLIDGNFENDHPVGFQWADGMDTEIYTLAAIDTNLGITGAIAFGSGNEMWCSSCHDVHGGAAGTPFLHISNAGSNLCLACHNK